MIVCLSALLSVFFVVPAHSQTIWTGDTLHEICHHDGPATKFGCLMYISATIETVSLRKVFDKGANVPNSPVFIIAGIGYDYCLPPTLRDREELRDIVVTYLDEHPEIRDLAAPVLIALSLREAFPC
jgi:hypothetical protein